MAGAAGDEGGVRKIIRKRIRRQDKGLNLAADVDAVVAVNTGSSPSQVVRHSSRHSVVQDSAKTESQTEEHKPGKEEEGS